ncbi:MAG: cache domain-containing protein, partial [Bacilli bacterium]
MKKHIHKLNVQLMLFFSVLFFIFFLLFSVMTGIVVHQQLQQTTVRETTQTFLAAQRAVSDRMTAVEETILNGARLPFDERSSTVQLEQLRTSVEKLLPVQSVYLVETDGFVTATEGAMLPDTDLRAQGYYGFATMTPDVVHWNEIRKAESSTNLVLTVSKAVFDGRGNLYGVIAADIDIDAFVEELRTLLPSADYTMFFLSEKGVIIQHPTLQGSVRSFPVLNDWFKQKETVFSKLDIAGHDELWKRESVPYLDLQMVISIPENVAMRAFYAIVGVQVGLGIMLLIILMIIIHFASRSFTWPLQKMTLLMQHVSSGDLTITLHTATKNEIGTLAQSIQDVIVKLRTVVEQTNETSVSLTANTQEMNALMVQNTDNLAHTSAQMDTISDGANSQLAGIQQLKANADVVSHLVEQTNRETDLIKSRAAETIQEMETGVAQIHQLAEQQTKMAERVENMMRFLTNLEDK